MSKTLEQLKPNYGPVYAAAMYPGLCSVFQKHGYALAVHGSLARDFDLIAVPWTEKPSDPETVISEMLKVYAVSVIDSLVKNHGRIAYTISVGFGECALDLSFMPIL